MRWWAFALSLFSRARSTAFEGHLPRPLRNRRQAAHRHRRQSRKPPRRLQIVALLLPQNQGIQSFGLLEIFYGDGSIIRIDFKNAAEWLLGICFLRGALEGIGDGEKGGCGGKRAGT